MPDSNDCDNRLRPRPMSRLRGTNRPGHESKPGGTNRPGHGGRPGGTNRPGHASRPGGTNRPGHASQPGESHELTSAVEGDDNRLTTNWVQYTERLKPGYSKARYDAWLEKWRSRPERTGKLWECVGPSNIGGRITCLAAREEYGTLLAGAACGGLWRQDITKERWTSIENDEANVSNEVVRRMHNIGALAVDPLNPDLFYCGTGHAYHAGDSFPGVGLFRSVDGGTTWAIVADADNDRIPHRISAIAVDPRPVEDNVDYKTRIRIGGVEGRLGNEDDTGELGRERPGMFYCGTTDDAVTEEPRWHRDNFRLDREFAKTIDASEKQMNEGVFEGRDYQCHAIAHYQNEQGEFVIMTAISGVLDWSGIWRSKNGGKTWEHLTRGLPAGREFGRTSLATSKKHPEVIYAFAGSADGQCLGVFRTSDGGKHWSSPAGPDHFAACGRLNYTNCIAVHPENPDLVVCGADDLHRSTDGGQTWTQITEWFADRTSPGYVHKDQHALLWVKKEKQYVLYNGNDGGVNLSDDDGVTWKNNNFGLANLMFYDIDVAPSSAEDTGLIIARGTQDNASVMTEIEARGVGYIPTELGVQLSELSVVARESKKNEEIVRFGAQPTVRVKGLTEKKDHFADMLDGDGGWIVFDPRTPLHLYGSSQFMAIYRHRIDDGWVTVTPPDATSDERGATWIAYIAMHPTNSNVVFTGSTRLWRTQNDGEDWTPVSDFLDGGAISAIEIADDDSKTIYLGTEYGNIFRSRDAGNRWSEIDGDPGPTPLEWRRDLKEAKSVSAKRAITRIETNPHDANVVVATMLGVDPVTGRQHRYPHVIWSNANPRSGNNNRIWKDADYHADGHHDLPDVHHNVVTWSGKPKRDGADTDPTWVFVGNDIGVWVGIPPDNIEDDKAEWKWLDISGNLPNVIVNDLVYHRASRSLLAATYGRSIWKLTAENLKSVISSAGPATPA
jgi:photosystem II stability/assembly factor-like uncharacterized protein